MLLRTNVWKRSRKQPRSFKIKHLNKLRSLKKRYFVKTRKEFAKKKGIKYKRTYKKGWTPLRKGGKTRKKR